MQFCWGTASIPNNTNTTVAFIKPFTNEVLNIQTTIVSSTYKSGDVSDYAFVNSFTINNFKIRIGEDGAYTVNWLAIGY